MRIAWRLVQRTRGPLSDECLASRCQPLHAVIYLGHVMRELGTMDGREERKRGGLLYRLCHVYEVEKLGHYQPFPTLAMPELEQLLIRLAQRYELAARSGLGASLVN